MRWRITPHEVVSAKDHASAFAVYCQQEIGCPLVTKQNLMVLRKQAKLLFEKNPQADWMTLCRVVDWCKARKKRPTHPHVVVSLLPYAWKDGYLPELDPSSEDPAVEERILQALRCEVRDEWMRRLTLAKGRAARREAVEEWERDVGMWLVLLSPWPRSRSVVEQKRREVLRKQLVACALGASTGTWALMASTASSTASSLIGKRSPRNARTTKTTSD